MTSCSKPSRRKGPLIAALFLLGACAPLSAALAVGPAPQQLQYEPPKLEIPIPNVSFTQGISNDSAITLPWIAQYISGVYTFALSIVGMVAAVMLIIGGFQYLTSAGDKARIAKGKKRIADALIGMTLAFGSYILLYTINPNLVSFASLQLMNVKTESYGSKEFFAAMESSDVNASVGGQPAVPGDDIKVPVPDGCPIPDADTNLPVTARPKFVDQILANQGGFINTTTVREKMLQIGYIAAACKIQLGSCGRTVGTITALGGAAGLTGCISGKSTASCVDNRGKELHGPKTKEQRMVLYANRCATENSSSWPVCSFAGCTSDSCIWSAAQNSPSTHCRRLDCVPVTPGFENRPKQDGQAIIAARNRIRDYMYAEVKAGRLDAGWPDTWVDALTPGDWVVLYNGNDDIVGSHSVMFASKGKNGYINVVQGSPGDITRNLRWCVKKECGDGMYPILEVYSPD